jgi:hypothetical protein
MKMSRREAVFGLATGIVALFGLSAIVMKSKIEEWKEIRKAQGKCLEQIQKDRITAGERDRWSKRFEEINKVVPPFPADKKMDVHWLSVMDGLASKDGVVISKRRVGEEKRIGDLYEIPIECQECEGNLEAVVRFLFDLQEQGAMLDIRQLLLKPKSATALRGRFTLYCAYIRQAAGKQ